METTSITSAPNFHVVAPGIPLAGIKISQADPDLLDRELEKLSDRTLAAALKERAVHAAGLGLIVKLPMFLFHERNAAVGALEWPAHEERGFPLGTAIDMCTGPTSPLVELARRLDESRRMAEAADAAAGAREAHMRQHTETTNAWEKIPPMARACLRAAVTLPEGKARSMLVSLAEGAVAEMLEGGALPAFDEQINGVIRSLGRSVRESQQPRGWHTPA